MTHALAGLLSPAAFGAALAAALPAQAQSHFNRIASSRSRSTCPRGPTR